MDCLAWVEIENLDYYKHLNMDEKENYANQYFDECLKYTLKEVNVTDENE